ncbi:TMV resistance protein N-like [Argentina anserina]|uniref:TMV resistance protein N-like n=1 Tax=Argentina anserina TaxID=57926 RepID=UPI0021768F3E|nr:TMV resistance protein N-like [Potentilla anserina]
MNSEIASSSIPSSSLKWTYDVFLSFTGKDTRRGFTNNLYNELVAQGIKTFMDDRELQKGKSISPELITAIEESNVALIVLSQNYASSTWCLDELLKILECMEARNTILPIFYDVDPCDVRRQTGTFAEAFTKHEKRFKNDTEKVEMWRAALTKVSNCFVQNSKDCSYKVQRWRAALTKVSNFSGWSSKDFRYDSELIKKIVDAVKMQSHPTLFCSMEDLIGIDSRVEDVHLLLGEGIFIGIWGMGGIGKTTIAKKLFDRISREFDCSSFISDVRSNGLVQSQKELISEMLGREIDVSDVDEGATMIMRFVRDKKVLLVLDDVNHSDQIYYLAGKENWFGVGSVIIITTRDAHLLVNHGVMRRYEVQRLKTDEALQLFCQNAFKKGYPVQSYRDLCNHVVNYVKGLPLALKVLGRFLYGRDRSAWESTLAKLSEVCNAEIFETLKISYDGLDDDEKKMFLDIACFYIRVKMHDLLQEMGHEIVRRESRDEPGKRSRLFLKEDVIQVLRKNKGTTTVEGILLNNNYGDDACTDLHLPGKSFSVMKNLRILLLCGAPVHLSDGLEYLSSELRLLVWSRCPLSSLASVIKLENLQELQMRHSQIEFMWEGKQPLYSLKRIDLGHSLNLLKTPDFSGSPDLEYLNLEGCIQLYEVDSSVGSLERLIKIRLKGCKNLRLLPSSVSGLKKLKILDIVDCSKLEKLPEDLGHLESLEALYVSGTALRELPSCMGLQYLKQLLFYSCRGPPVSKLLPSFAGLRSVTKLDLSFCNLLEGAIPNDLGCLSSLTELLLQGNQFVSLPDSLSQLYRLQLLHLSHCKNLQRLPHLPFGVQVNARNCVSLETLPVHLSRAFLLNCMKLVKQESMAFTSMKRHLQEVSQYHDEEARDTSFRFVIPGNKMPEWFNYQTVAPSVSIDLSPGWFKTELIGFAFCAVFAVHANRQLPPMFSDNHHHYIIVTMKVDGQESRFIDYKFDHIRALSDHLWFRYSKYLSSYFRHVEATDQLKKIEFSFLVKGQGLIVKKFGVRLVYEQDVAEFNQSNADIFDVAEVNESDTDIFYDALEFFPCDSGEAAVVSHAISKRGPSGGAFCFYEEPQLDRLDTLRTGRVQTPLPSTYLRDLIKLYPNRGLLPLSHGKRMI